MPSLDRSTTIDAPPARVFSQLETWEELPRWSTITVDHTGAGRCGDVGDTFEQTIRIAGLDIRTEWEVVEHDAPRVIAYRATGPWGGVLAMRQRVASVPTGTRVALQVDYRLPGGALGEVVGRIYAHRAITREAERTLQNLKRLLEAGDR